MSVPKPDIPDEIVTEPHSDNCPHCPSNINVFPESDPESNHYATLPEGEKQKHVFPCAWRNNKLCKGVCDKYGYEEEKHKHLLTKDLRI